MKINNSYGQTVRRNCHELTWTVGYLGIDQLQWQQPLEFDSVLLRHTCLSHTVLPLF